MVKSGNIRLVSELTYLGTRQDRRPRSRAYTCRCTRRAGCSTPRSPRTSPPAQERHTRQYLHRKKYILRKDLSKNIFLNVKIQPGPFSSRFFLLKSLFLQMQKRGKTEYTRTGVLLPSPILVWGGRETFHESRRDKKGVFSAQ